MKPFGNSRRGSRSGGGIVVWLILIVLIAVAVGAVVLMLTDVPAPVHHIEVAVPNDRPA